METMGIVGLGNPGSEYRDTRHNVGFRVLDELCKRQRTALRAGKGEYQFARTAADGTEVVLVAPMTFMNNSGFAVADIMERFGVALHRLLIVADDFALPLGRLRFRMRGSDGGHNGLASIIYALNSDDFARLRCGIGKPVMPPKAAMAQFVLSPFDADEHAAVEGMVLRAADAAWEFARTGSARPVNPAEV